MSADPTLVIIRLETDSQLAAVFPIVAQLRPRVAGGILEAFVAQVRQQERDGYRTAAGSVDGRPVVFAGYRPACTLARGKHLFVDDLVTDESTRGQGYGRAMLRWLAQQAMEMGFSRIHLDSRDSARGFYARADFEFSTSIPCSIDTQRLIHG